MDKVLAEWDRAVANARKLSNYAADLERRQGEARVRRDDRAVGVYATEIAFARKAEAEADAKARKLQDAYSHALDIRIIDCPPPRGTTGGGATGGGTTGGGTTGGGTSTGGTTGGGTSVGGGNRGGNRGGGARPPCPPGRQPINVGPNNKVGSRARDNQRAANAVTGAVAGLLGGGGGGGGSDGPRLVRCRLGGRESTVFSDAATGVALRVGARRTREGVVVYAGIEESPDKGTFQTAFVENSGGDRQAPSDVGACKLWGSWSLTVSWTRTTYVDGQEVSRESGGWRQQGAFAIPGVTSSGDRPDGLWRRLGFSNASNGAREIALTYRLSPADLAAGPVTVVIHVTRPGGDPVTTVPFVLKMIEGPTGFVFAQAQEGDCGQPLALLPAQNPLGPEPAPPGGLEVGLDLIGVVLRPLNPLQEGEAGRLPLG